MTYFPDTRLSWTCKVIPCSRCCSWTTPLHSLAVLEKCDPQSVESEDNRQKVSQLVASVGGDGCGGREKRVVTALDLDSAGLQPPEMEQLRSLVAEFAHLFALDSTELGRTSITMHEINTGDSRPLRQPPRRIPFALRSKVDSLVEDMLSQGVITPSSSPWASPIVLVAKKDSSTRFCVDYRRLNAVTKLDVHPLPRIDDSLDLLAGTKYFSSLDLASGYWQVGMTEQSQEKTAFATYAGLYEFTVMPFGLCNAPATFQRLMEEVLRGLAREKCLIYLDDVLVIGRTYEEHLDNLREVFTRLSRAGLRLKPSKCNLVRCKVEFLGYIVSGGGISADPKKIRAVTEYPTPTDVRGLRAFLGLLSYYRRFIPRFSAIAQPLYNLTRKDAPFLWTADCETAFDHLKGRLTQAPVLAYPQFGRDFLLETDASGVGLGAVLSQKQEDGSVRPIAFASRTLQVHEKNYGISEMEALGVVWAVKHFRHYIYGHHCTVFTDHEALKSLLNTPQPSGELARWGMALQELDLQIEYRPGAAKARADALSRYPVSLLQDDVVRTQAQPLVAAVVDESSTVAEGSDQDTLSHRQCQDPQLADIILYHESGELPQDEKRARELVLMSSSYTVLDGVLYRVEPDKTLKIIPPAVSRHPLFLEAHQGAFSGHLREAKIHGQLSKHYWWPRMRRDIAHWCWACLTCASRSVGSPVRPPLIPIPVGGPFDRVGVDVLQLPRTRNGNKYAVVFIDYLTKWPEVFATADQTAPTIAKLLVEGVISRHGLPHQLLSDRGPCFLSKLLLGICECIGVKKVNTSAYHPQSDGLVERFNRTLTDMLVKSVAPGTMEWDERLPYVLFAYRAALQTSTGESPFFLLYGRDPQLPSEAVLSPPVHRSDIKLDDYKSTMVREMGTAWDLAKETIGKAQKRQKRQHDKHTKNADFRVGERAFVLMPATKTGPLRKLARPFKGPYRVVTLHPNGADLHLIEKPRSEPIRVALNRLRRCPTEVAGDHAPELHSLATTSMGSPVQMTTQNTGDLEDAPGGDNRCEPPTVWGTRLRQRKNCSRANAAEAGEM